MKAIEPHCVSNMWIVPKGLLERLALRMLAQRSNPWGVDKIVGNVLRLMAVSGQSFD
jgi:hypothetical protein